MAYSSGTVTCFVPEKRSLQPESLLPSRGVAGSGLRPLPNIPHCCLPYESGPCLSPNVAGQPLSPATDRRLGGPLPRQLANQTRVHLRAINLWQSEPCDSTALCGISGCFQPLFPTPRQIAHALLTRPPLSSVSFGRILNPLILVRLACVKHAASVHPEPGSNSQ